MGCCAAKSGHWPPTLPVNHVTPMTSEEVKTMQTVWEWVGNEDDQSLLAMKALKKTFVQHPSAFELFSCQEKFSPERDDLPPELQKQVMDQARRIITALEKIISVLDDETAMNAVLSKIKTHHEHIAGLKMIYFQTLMTQLESGIKENLGSVVYKKNVKEAVQSFLAFVFGILTEDGFDYVKDTDEGKQEGQAAEGVNPGDNDALLQQQPSDGEPSDTSMILNGEATVSVSSSQLTAVTALDIDSDV
ncbi:uncharacterized protein LOC101847919 [Aplysia californica]|uniref:Globin n=1 Tax=Aplysia californica TaxID=6500 RepID=A0ABM0ZYS7_APLCA|nr:uncharacterized protein LOC101847919 [Aplysia californica]